MALTISPGKVRARQRESRLDTALVADLAATLADSPRGTVAVSGLVYPKSDAARCGSDGYAYRAAVGEVAGFGIPAKGTTYPVASMVRPVADILPLLEDAATADVPPLAEDATKEQRKEHADAVKSALSAIPDAYRYADADAVTWLLATRPEA